MKALVLCSVLLVGCAQNAILELTIMMPTAAETGVPAATSAHLDFQSSNDPDPSTLPSGGFQTVDLDLPTMAGETEQISVIAGSGDIETPLFMSVRYCVEGAPCAEGTGLTWVRFERAFYVGEFTTFATPLPRLGDPVREVPVCDVIGCIDGAPDSGCVAGVHYCER